MGQPPPGLEYDAGPKTPWYKNVMRSCKKFRCSDLKSTRFLVSSVITMLIITGLMLLIAGFILISEFNRYAMFIDELYLYSNLLISTAVIIFLTAIFGAYGMIHKKTKFVVAYITLLALILMLETTTATLAWFNPRAMSIERKMAMMNPYELYNEDGWHLKEFWDNMHRELQCCDFDFWRQTNIPAPISCCPLPAGARSPFECTMENHFWRTCSLTLPGIMIMYVVHAAVVTMAVVCVQLIIIGISVLIACRIKNNKKSPQSEIIIKDALKIDTSNPVTIDYSRF